MSPLLFSPQYNGHGCCMDWGLDSDSSVQPGIPCFGLLYILLCTGHSGKTPVRTKSHQPTFNWYFFFLFKANTRARFKSYSLCCASVVFHPVRPLVLWTNFIFYRKMVFHSQSACWKTQSTLACLDQCFVKPEKSHVAAKASPWCLVLASINLSCFQEAETLCWNSKQQLINQAGWSYFTVKHTYQCVLKATGHKFLSKRDKKVHRLCPVLFFMLKCF